MDTILRSSIEGSGPKYAALAKSIRMAVQRGELGEGAKMPPVRELAYQVGVTPGTVARAYSLLTDEGILEATVGRGTFVAPLRNGRSDPAVMVHETPAGHIDLASAGAPDVGQSDLFRRSLQEIVDGPDLDVLRYTDRDHDIAARRVMQSWIAERDVGPLDLSDIVLVSGAQNGLLVVMQTLLGFGRRTMLTEELAYAGFRHAAGLATCKVAAIQMDKDGVLPDALEAACRHVGPAVLCTSAEVHNPTTIRTTPERRQAVVDIARRYDLQIVDDCTFPAMPDHAPGYRVMAPERTWHLESLSKVVSPALRVGAIAAPEGWGGRALRTFQHQCYGLPRLSVELCRRLMETGRAATIQEKVRDVTNRRVEIAREILGRFELASREGVPFVWLTLPPGSRASSLKSAAAGLGIQMRAADVFALTDGRAPNAVRLSLNGVADDAELRMAFTRIRALLDEPSNDMAI